MKLVEQLHQEYDIVGALRDIADMIESGEIEEAEHLTMVYGMNVFHLGTIRAKESVTNSIWDLVIGKQTLLNAALKGVEK